MICGKNIVSKTLKIQDIIYKDGRFYRYLWKRRYYRCLLASKIIKLFINLICEFSPALCKGLCFNDRWICGSSQEIVKIHKLQLGTKIRRSIYCKTFGLSDIFVFINFNSNLIYYSVCEISMHQWLFQINLKKAIKSDVHLHWRTLSRNRAASSVRNYMDRLYRIMRSPRRR